jgi:hypothetical protein
MNKIDVKKQIVLAKKRNDKSRFMGFLRVAIGCDTFQAKQFVADYWNNPPKEILRELYSGAFGWGSKHIREIMCRFNPAKHPTYIYTEVYDNIEKRRAERLNRKYKLNETTNTNRN